MKTKTYEATVKVLLNGQEWKRGTYMVRATTISHAIDHAGNSAMVDGFGDEIEKSEGSKVSLSLEIVERPGLLPI